MNPRAANGSVTAPVAAAIAVVLASTAMSGVVVGLRWLGFVLVAAAAVAATGVLLRSVTLPAAGRLGRFAGRPLPLVVVMLGQLVTLSCLLTVVFTRTGLFAVIPTPTALSDLSSTLGGAMEQVRTGIPPVDATTEMLLLITLGLGLVAIVVDAVAVGTAAPAAAGLVLLCVFAVPASVADTLLPWWAFVAGAAGFAALLAVDGQRRHLAWRGPTTAPADTGATPTAAAVAGVALVAALLAGGALTAIGTIGRLPGDGGFGGAGGVTGVGLKPFTSLRGQLNRNGVAELFRVRGLDEQHYLRAMTLRRYNPGQGWEVSGIGGDPLGERLPLPQGQLTSGEQTTIEFEPLRYSDNWLPVYGVPLEVRGVGRGYRYDSGAGTIASDRNRKPGRYSELALFPEPTSDELRSAAGPDDIDPEYFQLDEVNDRVRQLAEEVTRDHDNRFDKALALNTYFTSPTNGFRYVPETTAGGDDDALVDFLFNGKTGYCEQYASSMGVLLRAVGIPSRVVIGYTAGFESGEARVITTDDAHAWVEVYFPEIGWITFDPTPLPDGRTVTPGYVQSEANQPNAPGQEIDPDETTTPVAPVTTGGPAVPAEDLGDAAQAGPADNGSRWVRPLGLTLLVVVLIGGLVTSPAVVREWQRRNRLRLVAAGGPQAATAAWRELLAESWDRGSAVPDTDTVRLAANRLAREHGLDDDGRRGLRSVVGAIERSWYGAGQRADAALADGLREVRESFRRNAPLALRARLMPRSVLRPKAEPPTDA